MQTTDQTFQQDVIEASKEKPVLVDFWAEWCGPCQMLSPIIEKVAEDYKDKITVAKLNIEENKETPAKYSVMSIPAVKLFKDEKIIAEFTGVRSETDIKAWVDANL